MTLQEVRMAIMRKGAVITEVAAYPTEVSEIKLIMGMVDTDRLRLEAQMTIYNDTYISNHKYKRVLNSVYAELANKLNTRHEQNPNTCQHKFITIGTVKACEYCMGKFGTQMVVDLGNN